MRLPVIGFRHYGGGILQKGGHRLSIRNPSCTPCPCRQGLSAPPSRLTLPQGDSTPENPPRLALARCQCTQWRRATPEKPRSEQSEGHGRSTHALRKALPPPARPVHRRGTNGDSPRNKWGQSPDSSEITCGKAPHLSKNAHGNGVCPQRMATGTVPNGFSFYQANVAAVLARLATLSRQRGRRVPSCGRRG